MTYFEKFVACIKVNNKILRETNSTVAIPFGSEYSIFLKNQNTRRALVRVSIDGQDATENTWLIAEPNVPLELERFIRNGNLNKGNKFKFIERTSRIEEHRGIGSDDGLIRVEYKFESIPTHSIWTNNVQPTYYPSGTITNSLGNIGQAQCNVSYSAKNFSNILRSAESKPVFTKSTQNMMVETEALNDAGITVNGGESDQKFTYGAYFPTETETHVIVINVKGEVKGAKVVKAVTVDVKPTCTSCGKVNKATNKFCAECGTGLQVFA